LIFHSELPKVASEQATAYGLEVWRPHQAALL